ncbi:hypothetical protein BDV25DRAFT_150014 [Aspergillus avenaceus]|uniref:RING-type domain-containing protein n=1 Tax=Aspergillus avenaceus TaxID=36643 RepID=A0A5N6U3K0_ASPAV|nr:hypothetical protein BDV25DRAFT_150014 [Aspergillus avenaceus]
MSTLHSNIAYLRSPSFTPRQSHLCDVIGLYPEEEAFCAGYAPSQGRRCKCRTNAADRRTACNLLGQANDRFRAGIDVDDLLDALAPLVLCRRFHRYQADDLTTIWRRRLRSSQPSPRPAQRAEEDDFVREVYIAGLHQKIDELAADLRRAERERDATPTPPGRRVISREITTNPTLVEATAVPASPPRMVFRSPTTGQGRSASATTTHEQARNDPLTNGSTPSTPSAERSRPTDRASSPSTPTPHIQPSAVRRRIEGECSICTMPLQGPDQSTARDEESRSQNDDNHQTQREGQREQSTERDTNGRSTSEELVWCKAQCGHNYHKACMDEWISQCQQNEDYPRPANCPTCRCAWRS